MTVQASDANMERGSVLGDKMSYTPHFGGSSTHLSVKLKGQFPAVILNHSRLATIQNKTRRPALRGESVRLSGDSSLGDMPMESCACRCYLFGR